MLESLHDYLIENHRNVKKPLFLETINQLLKPCVKVKLTKNVFWIHSHTLHFALFRIMSGNEPAARKSIHKQSDSLTKNYDIALSQYASNPLGSSKPTTMSGTPNKNPTLLKGKVNLPPTNRTIQANGNNIVTMATTLASDTTTVSTVVANAEQVKNDNLQLLSDTRNKLIQYYISTMDNLRMNFQESLQQLFFIQSGGNMVDYPSWKLRPTTHLMSYLASHRLDDSKIAILSNSLNAAGKSTNNIENNSRPSLQKSNSKDSGNSVEQYGFVQGLHLMHDDKNPRSKHIDSKLGVHKNIDSKHLVQNTVSSSRQPSTSGADIVGQVRHESETLHRISELRKSGLWSASRLPKVFELPKKKSHHDYMLEEMQWLATDFSQEKRWKRNMAKKVCSTFQSNLYNLFVVNHVVANHIHHSWLCAIFLCLMNSTFLQ